MTSSKDWAYMDTLRPPVYICLRRKLDTTGEHHQPMQLDGCIDKEEWAHVPWSDSFVNIEGSIQKSKHPPLTRFKMMYDEDYLYVGAELVEPKIWGTLTQKNSSLYQENNFEIFFNPDGSHHHYYELEINCLNTIWELLLHRPYKDGSSLENPFNLVSLRSAVFIDGVTNSPETECVRWCIEMSWSLAELQQFNKFRFKENRHDLKPSIATPRPSSTCGETPRSAVTTSRTVSGDIWRVNFLRVQYELETVMNEDINQLQYQKVPNKSAEYIAWAPTGVMDIHRPEKWGYVFFSSENELVGGELELASVLTGFLNERMAIERILNAIYYEQRDFYALHGGYASTMETLYTKHLSNSQSIENDDWMKTLSFHDLLRQYDLSFPVLSCQSVVNIHETNDKTIGGQNASVVTGRKYSRRYAPALDKSDEHLSMIATDGINTFVPPPPPVLSPRSQKLKSLEARGLYSNYVVTVRSTMQEWHIRQDGRLWQTA
ncbi:putative Carbohydrate-binding domain, family 9 [Plasmopara halstedii]